MINLESEYIDYIKKVINSYLNSYELYIFGSRTKGTAKKYSDIDLAIKSKELTESIKSAIEFDFEDSTIPYEIDLIDLDNITEDFKNIIKDSLVKIN